MESSREIEAKLSDLRDKLSPDQFEQARLSLRCMGLSGQELDDSKDLSDLKDIICGSKDHKDMALPILQRILEIVGVSQSEQLGELGKDQDQDEKVESVLKFPALIVTLCRRLGNDDFGRLKRSMSRAVLGCNHSVITSREDLMKRLIQQNKVTQDNVEELRVWLKSAGRNDLVTKVVEYETARSSQREFSTVQASTEDQPGFNQDVESQLALIAKSTDTEDSDLNRHIFSHHLEEMEKILQGDLPGNQSLEEWYTLAGGERATFRDLGNAYVKNKLPRSAVKVCESAKAVCYCEKSLESSEFVGIQPFVPPSALAGSVRHTDLWDKSRFPELRIFFMNPDVLSAPTKPWFCGKEKVTTELIISWAEIWNNASHTKYPRISTVPAQNIEDSEIRIKFGTTGRCWSYVGKSAQEHPGNVTMYLNLYGQFVRNQKSLVRHEFGHALGLVHEHQRSDFWSILEQYVDKSKLSQASEEHLKPLQGTLLQTKYDPDSIMHYWFDINWLKPEYQDLDQVRRMSDDRLPQLAKRVIEGVHRRDYKKGLMAESPSKRDFESLDQAYALT